MTGRSERVTALYVVYDADGTRVGELLYMIRKLLGIAHCAACDITHGPRTEKPAFTRLKSVGWSVPLLNIHRDEMDKALAGAVGKVLPVVAARTVDGRDVVLLGPRQLDECCGEVGALEAAINAALAGAALVTPPFPPQPASREPALQEGLQLVQPPLHVREQQKARPDLSLVPGHDVPEDGTVPILDENRNRPGHIFAPAGVDTVVFENVTSSSGDESVASLSFSVRAETASVIPDSHALQHCGVEKPRNRRNGNPSRSSSLLASIPIAQPSISRQKDSRSKRRFFDPTLLTSTLFGVPMTRDTSYLTVSEAGEHLSPPGCVDEEYDGGLADVETSRDCDAIVPGSYN